MRRRCSSATGSTLIWSGWPAGEDVQYLYIAPMSNPYTISGNRVKLCENDDHVWERVGQSPAGRGLHEGPQVLVHGDRGFIVYSCSGSWEPTYKLGLLSMDREGGPARPEELEEAGQARVSGHGPRAGRRPLPLYAHRPTARRTGSSTTPRYPPSRLGAGGLHAAVHLDARTGFPDFGKPVPPGKTLKAPAGESANQPGDVFADSFDRDNWDNWSYYGYNRLHLGGRRLPESRRQSRLGAGQSTTDPARRPCVRGFEWSDFTATGSRAGQGGQPRRGSAVPRPTPGRRL